MKTDKMADLGSLHTFVYACPLLFLSGINKVFVFYIYLCLCEDRMRLGITKPENCVFACLCARLSLSLLHEDRMRLGIAKPENFVFICLCARLSLSLYIKSNRLSHETPYISRHTAQNMALPFMGLSLTKYYLGTKWHHSLLRYGVGSGRRG